MKNSVSRWAARRPNDSMALKDIVCGFKDSALYEQKYECITVIFREKEFEVLTPFHELSDYFCVILSVAV